MKQSIKEFSEMLEKAMSAVVFTGAGVSTESGIPDFRSPGTGIWNKISPIEFEDFLRSPEKRKESWQRKFSGDGKLTTALPNRGHRAISHLVDTGKVHTVITQNIDNLHQKSGIPTERILELHGNAHFATCLACNLRYELEELKVQYETKGEVEPCTECGGIIKTATISFGQALPVDVLSSAQDASNACDLFLVVGSSLQVYPAAYLPQMAKESGANLVILNREPTPLDPHADLVLHEEIGPTLGEVVGVN